MDSDSDTACAVGCPIRRSRDQRSLASPPGFSQRAASFIASQCQGIHQMPFLALDPGVLPRNTVRRKTPRKTAAHRAQPQPCRPGRDPAATSHQDTSPDTSSRLPGHPCPPRSHKLSLHPINQPAAPGPDGAPNGGGERVRTDDLLLAKQALSQLSYTPGTGGRQWWAREDLNLRPHAYQARALTS